ncbi:putative Radial spoke head 10 [Blattamonas nauphoetae]|uniref:Radial spoke head 10 n=1 Tax=Blattamonas nauphoetae TaxID=2049346 RepID=A0ABQ9YLW4_9EUKA|nr:putative Radial spoke head 10 [Blattamonas nauphoetae]
MQNAAAFFEPALDANLFKNCIAIESKGDIENGAGTVRLREGHTYTGRFKNGKMQGIGSLEFPDGTKYLGQFVSNQMHGYGRYIWPNGCEYEGEIRFGNRTGFGTMTMPNGIKYEGDWENGLKEGWGVLIYNEEQTSRYEGEFHGGRRNGKGLMVYPNGDEYEGYWVNDKRSGHGEMRWHSIREVYKGDWRNDKPHGSGEHIWSLSNIGHYPFMYLNRYVGDFEGGFRDGVGTMFYADGGRYEGEWKLNKKHGPGMNVSGEGMVVVGEWIDDKLAHVHNQTATKDGETISFARSEFGVSDIVGQHHLRQIGDAAMSREQIIEQIGMIFTQHSRLIKDLYLFLCRTRNFLNPSTTFPRFCLSRITVRDGSEEEAKKDEIGGGDLVVAESFSDLRSIPSIAAGLNVPTTVAANLSSLWLFLLLSGLAHHPLIGRDSSGKGHKRSTSKQRTHSRAFTPAESSVISDDQGRNRSSKDSVSPKNKPIKPPLTPLSLENITRLIAPVIQPHSSFTNYSLNGPFLTSPSVHQNDNAPEMSLFHPSLTFLPRHLLGILLRLAHSLFPQPPSPLPLRLQHLIVDFIYPFMQSNHRELDPVRHTLKRYHIAENDETVEMTQRSHTSKRGTIGVSVGGFGLSKTNGMNIEKVLLDQPFFFLPSSVVPVVQTCLRGLFLVFCDLGGGHLGRWKEAKYAIKKRELKKKIADLQRTAFCASVLRQADKEPCQDSITVEELARRCEYPVHTVRFLASQFSFWTDATAEEQEEMRRYFDELSECRWGEGIRARKERVRPLSSRKVPLVDCQSVLDMLAGLDIIDDSRLTLSAATLCLTPPVNPLYSTDDVEAARIVVHRNENARLELVKAREIALKNEDNEKAEEEEKRQLEQAKAAELAAALEEKRKEEEEAAKNAKKPKVPEKKDVRASQTLNEDSDATVPSEDQIRRAHSKKLVTKSSFVLKANPVMPLATSVTPLNDVQMTDAALALILRPLGSVKSALDVQDAYREYDQLTNSQLDEQRPPSAMDSTMPSFPKQPIDISGEEMAESLCRKMTFMEFVYAMVSCASVKFDDRLPSTLGMVEDVEAEPLAPSSDEIEEETGSYRTATQSQQESEHEPEPEPFAELSLLDAKYDERRFCSSMNEITGEITNNPHQHKNEQEEDGEEEEQQPPADTQSSDNERKKLTRRVMRDFVGIERGWTDECFVPSFPNEAIAALQRINFDDLAQSSSEQEDSRPPTTAAQKKGLSKKEEEELLRIQKEKEEAEKSEIAKKQKEKEMKLAAQKASLEKQKKLASQLPPIPTAGEYVWLSDRILWFMDTLVGRYLDDKLNGIVDEEEEPTTDQEVLTLKRKHDWMSEGDYIEGEIAYPLPENSIIPKQREYELTREQIVTQGKRERHELRYRKRTQNQHSPTWRRMAVLAESEKRYNSRVNDLEQRHREYEDWVEDLEREKSKNPSGGDDPLDVPEFDDWVDGETWEEMNARIVAEDEEVDIHLMEDEEAEREWEEKMNREDGNESDDETAARDGEFDFLKEGQEPE